jgi:hypothetical protein
MRILLAIVLLIAAVALLGFFGLCISQAISDLGLVLAVLEIIDSWENIVILGGCLLFGVALLIFGVVALVIRPEPAR